MCGQGIAPPAETANTHVGALAQQLLAGRAALAVQLAEGGVQHNDGLRRQQHRQQVKALHALRITITHAPDQSLFLQHGYYAGVAVSSKPGGPLTLSSAICVTEQVELYAASSFVIPHPPLQPCGHAMHRFSDLFEAPAGGLAGGASKGAHVGV